MNCLIPYPRDIFGVNSTIWCINATRVTAVRRPTPLRPAIKREPPGMVRTRSTCAMLSRTSLKTRTSKSRFSRPTTAITPVEIIVNFPFSNAIKNFFFYVLKAVFKKAAGFVLCHPVALHFFRSWMSQGSTFSIRLSADRAFSQFFLGLPTGVIHSNLTVILRYRIRPN